MAALGSIGVDLGFTGKPVVFDISQAWDIAQNPANTPVYLSAFSVAKPKKEQWKQISGTVLDDSGAPAARFIRAIDRRTGLVLTTTTSSGSTGDYALLVPVGTDVEIQRVVLDDAAGMLYNDIIDRVFAG